MSIVAAVSGDDNSERIVEEGVRLAEAFDETLVVVHVMSEEEFDEHSEIQTGYSVSKGENNAVETAKDVVRRLDDPPSGVETVGRVGDPATQVLAEAQQRDSRYIVIGGRKRSPTGKAVFGSPTQSVILNASRPVVTVLAE